MSEYTLVERVTATLKVMGLRPVVVEEAAPFLNKSKLWDPQGRPWTPARLRVIDRGPDATEDALRQAIVDDPAVRRDVIEICSTVNDNSYDPGLYRRRLDFARRHDRTG